MNIYGILLILFIALIQSYAETRFGEPGYRRRLEGSTRPKHELPQRHEYSHPLHSRVAVHFPDIKSFLKSSRELEDGPVITCTSYKTSQSARDILLTKFRGVHRIYNDAKTDRACFMATHADGSSTEVLSLNEERYKKMVKGQEFLKNIKHKKVPHFTTWHFMHPALKLNPAVIRHLFEHNEKFDVVSQMHQGRLERIEERTLSTEGEYLQVKTRDNQDLRYELLVDFVPMVEGSKSRDAIMEDLHEHLHSSGNTATLVEKMIASHPHSRELWETGRSCSDGSVFGSDASATNYQTEDTIHNTRRLQFIDAAEDYYHGFKLASDHLHGWGDRTNEKRTLVEGKADHPRHTAVAGDIDEDGMEKGISQGCYVAMLAKLALHPEVIGISTRPRLMLTNNAAKGVIQSNNVSSLVSDDHEANSWPYQAAGLNGSEQVVTIADTGLDTTHCSFAGSASDTGITEIAYASFILGDESYDNSYRKVIQYVAYVDAKDTYSGTGHGTHVAGSSVGSNYDTTNNEYDGMAIGAKTSFFDIGSYSSGSLYTPSPFYSMFKPGVNAGSRIFSGSFGYAYNYYSSDSVNLDYYLYAINTDYMAILSVGNEGQEGFYSAIDPAQAKNALAVGSCESSFHDTSGYTRKGDPDNVPYFSSLGPTFDYRYKPDVVVPGHFIKSADDYTTCSFASSAGTSMSAGIMGGVAAQIRQFYVDDAFSYARNMRINPSAASQSPSGALIKASIIHSGRQMKKYNVPYQASPQSTIVQQNLELTGRRGGYSAGFNEDPMDSDAIGRSAQRPDYVQGFGRVDLQNLIPLNFTDDEDHRNTEHGFDLHVWDKYTLGSSETTYFWVTTTASVNTSFVSQGLKATLVWMDYWNYYVAEKFLLHDLDLIIEKVGSVGSCEMNRPSSAKPIWFGNGGSEPDTHNNVEMIHIPADALEPSTTYRVLVRSKILDGYGSTINVNQPFSLVLTAPNGSHVASEVETDYSCTDYDKQNLANDADWTDFWRLSACDNATELEVELHLTSHSGDGWANTGYYQIHDASGSLVKSGGMNSSDAMTALREKVTVCLATGTYIVTLGDTDTSNMETGLYNMGMLSPMCKMKLQGRYQTTMTLEVAANMDGTSDDSASIIPVFKCNECASNQIEADLMVWSSLYGGKISYGWHTGTSYRIERTCTIGDDPGTYTIATNAPNAGIMEHHKYCLPDGMYNIGYFTISSDDDFKDLGVYDSSFSSAYGVEEYEIDVYLDHSYQGSLDSYYSSGGVYFSYVTPYYNQYEILTGSSNNCTAAGEEFEQTNIIVLLIGIFMLLTFICVCVYAFYHCFIGKHGGALRDAQGRRVVRQYADPHDNEARLAIPQQAMYSHNQHGRLPVEVEAVPMMASAPTYLGQQHIQLANYPQGAVVQLQHQQPQAFYEHPFQQGRTVDALPSYGESIQPAELEEAEAIGTRTNQVVPGNDSGHYHH